MAKKQLKSFLHISKLFSQYEKAHFNGKTPTLPSEPERDRVGKYENINNDYDDDDDNGWVGSGEGSNENKGTRLRAFSGLSLSC